MPCRLCRQAATVTLDNTPMRVAGKSRWGIPCLKLVYLTVLRVYPNIDWETVLDGELAVPFTRNPL